MTNDKPGNGNGVKSTIQEDASMCPVSPGSRPENCKTFEQRMAAVERRQETMLRDLKQLGGDVRAGNKLLGWIADNLALVAAGQGRKIKPPTTASRASLRKK